MSGTTQQYIRVWAEIAVITASSVAYTWLHNNTGGSILVAMLFHWTSNAGSILFPYWQMGIFGGTIPELPNLWIPTHGMLIGFGVTLVVSVLITSVWGSQSLRK